MSLNYLKFGIFITLFVIIEVSAALKCTEQTACSCHLLGGSHYDLSKLSLAGPFNGSGTYDYTYSFQPCKNVNLTLGLNKSVNECNNSTGVSLCAQFSNSEPFSLGNVTETQWNLQEKDEPELILHHGNKTAHISLHCCPMCNSTFVLVSAPAATKFNFLLASPHCCKMEGPPEGLSTGSVLVILLFVLSGVYLLVGALALRFFRGAIGWELIPNYDFWSDLPALVRDGIAFTFSGCSAESYDRI